MTAHDDVASDPASLAPGSEGACTEGGPASDEHGALTGRVSSYDEYLQTYRPDEWERLRRERLTPEQIAYEDVTAAIRAAAKAVSEDACRHCGALPEADGDHSCPCPHSDESCPDHPLIAPARVQTPGGTS